MRGPAAAPPVQLGFSTKTQPDHVTSHFVNTQALASIMPDVTDLSSNLSPPTQALASTMGHAVETPPIDPGPVSEEQRQKEFAANPNPMCGKHAWAGKSCSLLRLYIAALVECYRTILLL